jgi:hypothetical protein
MKTGEVEIRVGMGFCGISSGARVAGDGLIKSVGKLAPSLACGALDAVGQKDPV